MNEKQLFSLWTAYTAALADRLPLQHWPLWLWFCLHSFTISNVKTTGKKEGLMAFGVFFVLFCFGC